MTVSPAVRPGWTAADMPDQSGRTIVVTGANSGLGEATARALAAHGARVVLACRDTGKGEQAAARMTGDVSVSRLDLADLACVRAFAERTGPVDVLVNNAGVMAVPRRQTADGFELQFGTNFLGPFALTGLLLPKIGDRVVTVSSALHRAGRVRLDDLDWRRRRYRRWGAYCDSKLADLMFAYELQRRLDAAGSPVRSLACHPGYASTELASHTESLQDLVLAAGARLLSQPAATGALPTLYAATMDVPGGSYLGPDRLGGMRGHPAVASSSRAARDAAAAAQLWAAAERLTGVTFG